MKRIYILGVGKGKEIVKENLIETNVELLGYIDKDAQKYINGVDGKRVVRLESIDENFDYIVVSVMRYRYIDEQLTDAGIRKDKVIHFFSFDDASTEEYWSIFNKHGWQLEALLYDYKKKVRPYSQNLIYELSDTRVKKSISYPNILSAEEAVKLILKEHKSLVRFGDGEFEAMQMKKRAKFQPVNKNLADRLKEILVNKNENIITAISDTYGSLEKYTDEAAEDIRSYLRPEVRREHMELLDMDKTYYDAFLSRPYILYKDKENSKKRFKLLKQIWKARDVIIVEGNQTRMGVGNDLLDNAHSIKRVIAPNENAFEKYDEILKRVKNMVKDEIILIALGPTATVLAYDLACSGFWAIDIGHLDLEYEWYCSGTKETYNISYKYVNEVNCGNQVSELPECMRDKYTKEIVCDFS